MITFSLTAGPQSSITIDDLWDESVAAVTEVLTNRGYTLEPVPAVVDTSEHAQYACYQLHPAGGVLQTTQTLGADTIEFVLDGPWFGKATSSQMTDQVLWMQLVHLGRKWTELYAIIALVRDPAVDTPPIEPPASA